MNRRGSTHVCSGLGLVHRDTCMYTHMLCLTFAPPPYTLVEKPHTWTPCSCCPYSLFTQPYRNRN